MKYKYFTVVLLAVLCLFGHIAFAESDNFDIKQLSPWWLEGIPEPTLVEEFELLDEELTVLSNHKRRYELMEQRFTATRETLAADLAAKERVLSDLESMSKEIQGNIKKHKNDSETLTEELAYLEKELKSLELKQKEGVELMKKMITESYIDSLQGGKVSSLSDIFLSGVFGDEIVESHSKNILRDVHNSLIIKQKNLETNLLDLKNTLGRKLAYKEKITRRLDEYANELQETQELEEEIKASTVTQYNTLNKKIGAVSRRQQVLDTKIEKKIYSVNEKKQSLKTEYDKKIIEYENLLRKRSTQYGCETKTTTMCVWINKYISAEKSIKQNSQDSLSFQWPISAQSGFGYHFRDQTHHGAYNEHHTGLDILSPTGVDVQSMESGYILFQQVASSKSPGIVAVKHPQGYISVYIGVIPSQNELFSLVKKGDIIGKTRRNTGNYSKNNLHIELYINEKMMDPLEQLDTSELETKVIPKRYAWKYIDDLKKADKSPDVEKIQKELDFFYIPGSSERERQDNLLLKYAAPAFRDKNVWIEASISESIDPTFSLCIGLAESSLGRNLTTPGNIGNVGNTDGGDRVNYNAPADGVRAISRVLNNTWLGSYITVDQLSRWGNDYSSIYASSPTNWHENIIKCMSAIKGRYVGNQATFRLTQANLLIYQQEGFGQNIK